MSMLAIVLTVIFSVIALFAFIFFGVFMTNYIVFRNRGDGTAKPFYYYVSDYKKLTSRKFSFKQADGYLLDGVVLKDKNRKEFKGVILFFHGLGSAYIAYLELIQYYALEGYIMVAFNYTGSFSSEGRSTFGLPQSNLDAKFALDFIKNDDELSKYPLYAMGHSWGGFTSMCSVLQENSQVKKVVEFSGFDNCISATFTEFPALKILTPFMALSNLLLFGRVSRMSMHKAIKNRSDVKFFMVHGDADTMVSPKYSFLKIKKLVEKKGYKNVTMKYVPGMGHCSYLTIESNQYLEEQINFNIRKKNDYKEPRRIDILKANTLNIELLKEISHFLDE